MSAQISSSTRSRTATSSTAKARIRRQSEAATSSQPSKSQQAYRWIKDRIADGAFAPGYRLVLGAIGGELDMSVVPVREAVRQLEAEGLVTFERNVGAHVAMVEPASYQASMQALGLLEAAATSTASPHLSAADLRAARAINQRMIDLLSDFDPHAFTSLNQQFHALLFSKCPNPRLLELVEAEWSRLGNMRDSIFTFVPDRARESVREHATILDRIEAGAPSTEIESLMRAHRDSTLDAFNTRNPTPKEDS